MLVAGFTEPAVELVDPNYTANIAMNYYFMAVSAIFLLIIIYFLTTKLTIPRLGTYTGQVMDDEELTPAQISALRWANVSAVITAIAFIALSIPENGLLRNPETGSLVTDSPLMRILLFSSLRFYFLSLG